jgi:glycogen debranching enzyme
VDGGTSSRRGANTSDARREAREKFLAPVLEHLETAGLGHVSEIADAQTPFEPKGCPFQAWSLGELLRLDRLVLTESAGLTIAAAAGGAPPPSARKDSAGTARSPRLRRDSQST